MLKYVNSQRYTAMLAVIAVAMFFTNLSIYKYSVWPLPILEPKYDLLALGILCLPILWHRLRQGRVLFMDKFLWFACATAVIFLMGTVVHPHSTNLSLLTEQFTGLAFLLLCYFLFRDSNATLVARGTLLACVIFAVLVNLFEVLYPGAFSNVVGRSAGFYINPNTSAYALDVGLVLTVSLLPERMRFPFLIAVGAAVFSTLSRSGILLFIVTASVFVFQGVIRPDWRRASVFANTFLIVVCVLFFYYAYTTIPAYTSATHVKITSTGPEIGLSEPDAVTQDSAGSRVERLEDGMQLYSQDPIWGIGMGQAWALETHNSYLLYGLAYGLVGWILVPAFALVVVTDRDKGIIDRRVYLVMAIALLLIGIFSHNLLMERSILLPLALTASSKARALPYAG